MKNKDSGRANLPDKSAVLIILAIVASAVLSTCIYRFFAVYMEFYYISIIYMALLFVLVVVYLMYNRGMSLNGVTADMLSDTMSAEEKEKLLKSHEDRRRRSKWMLIPILAICVAIAVDVLELYFIPIIEEWLA